MKEVEVNRLKKLLKENEVVKEVAIKNMSPYQMSDWESVYELADDVDFIIGKLVEKYEEAGNDKSS